MKNFKQGRGRQVAPLVFNLFEILDTPDPHVEAEIKQARKNVKRAQRFLDGIRTKKTTNGSLLYQRPVRDLAGKKVTRRNKTTGKLEYVFRTVKNGKVVVGHMNKMAAEGQRVLKKHGEKV